VPGRATAGIRTLRPFAAVNCAVGLGETSRRAGGQILVAAGSLANLAGNARLFPASLP
jgi:hypothetical protein